jgi:hypothetical protein
MGALHQIHRRAIAISQGNYDLALGIGMSLIFGEFARMDSFLQINLTSAGMIQTISIFELNSSMFLICSKFEIMGCFTQINRNTAAISQTSSIIGLS